MFKYQYHKQKYPSSFILEGKKWFFQTSLVSWWQPRSCDPDKSISGCHLGNRACQQQGNYSSSTLQSLKTLTIWNGKSYKVLILICVLQFAFKTLIKLFCSNIVISQYTENKISYPRIGRGQLPLEENERRPLLRVRPRASVELPDRRQTRRERTGKKTDAETGT